MKKIDLSKKDKKLYGYEDGDCGKLMFSDVLMFMSSSELNDNISKENSKKLKVVLGNKNEYSFYFSWTMELYLKELFEKPNYKIKFSEDPATPFYHVEWKTRHVVLAPFKGYFVLSEQETSEDINDMVEMYIELYPKLVEYHQNNLEKFSPGFNDMFKSHVEKVQKHTKNGKIQG